MDYNFERRKHRRIELPLVANGKTRQSGQKVFEQATTTDISFGGAYVKASNWHQKLKPDDVISVSISVPPQIGSKFPFSRAAGRARVVRVEMEGVALEFASDIVFLSRAV